MVSETVNTSDSKTIVEAETKMDADNKVNSNKSEWSCWNCLTTMAAETAAETEPATLPKIRRENRQKYKLYSFVASYISKPKTIPLAQKVGENYAIGKKIEQRLIESAAQTNISQIVKIKKNETVPDKLESSIESEEDAIKPEIFENTKSTPEDKEKKIQDYIKEYNLFEAYKSIRRKTPTPNSTLQRTKDTTLDDSDISNSGTNASLESTQSPNYKKLEIVQPKITIRKVYESPSISITSNTYITKNQENIDAVASSLSQTSSVGKEERRESVSSLSRRPSLIKQDKIIPNLVFQASIPKAAGSSSSLTNKSHSSNTSMSEPTKTQHFLCKSLKIEEINKGKSLTSPVIGMPLVSPRKYTPTYSTDNIVHKVQIETSTPKLERSVDSAWKSSQDSNSIIKLNKNQDDIDEIIEGLQNISLETKELPIRDKVENASSNGSESGYSGSSTRDLHDADAFSKKMVKNRLSIESGNETESPQLSQRSPQPKFKSSLPVLVSRYKDISASTKSLVTGFNPKVNEPVKKLRWSTLGLPHTSTDEVYSDSLPGYATLPARSHSPLPHERDMDRDRFSHKMIRSESVSSVYSGAGEVRGNVTVRGEVQFSLVYNYRMGALEVGVKKCRDLAPVDTKRNRSDPYVKVYLLPDKSKAGKRKTKVKKNTLNPVFDETLSFLQPLASLSSRTLWLSAWSADTFGRNDFLGEVTLPLADVVYDDPAPTWYKLHERTESFDEQQGTRGDLIVGLKFELHETGALRGKGTLHVLVKEAKNLVATKPNGLADVFCKSYLLPERGRLVKQKTAVVRRSLNPRWEQTFTYRGLKMQELSSRALELSLWDRDRLASNDFMGAVRLSLGSGTYMGANVNWMDSVGKEVTLWQTMMQRPNFWVEGSLPLRPKLSN